MKIQVTKIEAGQTIKIGRVNTTKESIENCKKQIALGWDWVKDTLKEYEEKLAQGVEGTIKTEGKHTLELKVLEVKEYASYSGVFLGNRTLGSNYALLVTDKGKFLAPNRNKVTLVD